MIAEKAKATERYAYLFREMLKIRKFDEAAAKARQKGILMGPVHTSIGQEAVATGICAHLRKADIITSTHRGHAHVLAKGASPSAMLSELHGRASGLCGGKGGSMHVADFSLGIFGANGVVGAGISIAVGAAHASLIRGDDRIVVCFFGDGAINRGPFLEGLNWARVYDLPILFVCEDNQFSSGTRTRRVTAGAGAVARAEGIGVPGVAVDGNDVIAVDAVAGDLVARIRAGKGPFLLHALTYRLQTHTVGDTRPIDRLASEFENRLAEEPIGRCARKLIEFGIHVETLTAIEKQIEAEIDNAVKAAEQAPWPDLAAAFSDVQDMGGPR